MPKIHTYSSIDTFHEAVVTSIRSRMMKAQINKQHFRIALSGGSTPGPIYKKISELKDIDWSMVEIFLVDERYVPYEDECSNARMIDELLIKKLKTKPAKVVYFETSKDIQEALRYYEKELNTQDQKFFDLILLGMGADGHTASLFPNDDLLQEDSRWVGHSQKGDPIPDRLTLTYPALEASKEIFFLLKGENKQETFNKVQQGSVNDPKLPSTRLFQLPQTQVFYMNQ